MPRDKDETAMQVLTYMDLLSFYRHKGKWNCTMPYIVLIGKQKHQVAVVTVINKYINLTVPVYYIHSTLAGMILRIRPLHNV